MTTDVPDMKGMSAADARVLRIGGVLGCLWLLYAGWFSWVFGGGYENVAGSAVSFCIYVLFFVVGYLTFKRDLPPRYALWVALAIVVALVGYTFVLVEYRTPDIQTDGLALSLAAAQLAIHGHNPYAADLVWAYQAYHMPLNLGTPQINGTTVSTLPYPALAFLLYIPTQLAHVDARWASLAAMLVAIALAYQFAPKELRTLAPLVFLIDPNYVEYMVGAVQDVDYLAPLMLAAFLWTDLPVLAGVGLGIACAVKQEPWLDVPFFLIGVHVTGGPALRLKWLRTLKAAAAIVAAFAVPNAYYAATAPIEWARGALEPFTAKHVEYGIGLVTFALNGSMHIPHWQLSALSIGALAVCTYVGYRYFHTLRNALWLAPALALFLAPRSLENYLLYVVPVCMASWLGSLPESASLKERVAAWSRGLRLTKAAAGLSAIVCCIALVSCSGQSDIHARVQRVEDTGRIGLANKLAVIVTNSSAYPVSTTYLVAWSNYKQFLWRCATGCGAIGGHASQAVTIEAPDYGAAIPNGATAMVRVVNAHSGDEYTSDRFRVQFPAVHLINPCFCITKDVGYTVPAGWVVSRAAFASGLATFENGVPRGRLTLDVRASAAPGWSYTSAYQRFVPFDHPINAFVSKTVVANDMPDFTRYAGVSIADEAGHFELFMWGDVTSTRVFKQTGVYVVEPASQPGDALTIDFNRYRELAGFAPGGRYTLRLVVAGRMPRDDLSATFSGFGISAEDNRLDAVLGTPAPLPT